MEDITTELKLKVALLKKSKKEAEVKYIEFIRELLIENGNLKVENINLKRKIDSTKKIIETLNKNSKMSDNEYELALEVLNG